MEEDNIFDEDDALDYIIYENNENVENKPSKAGCLSVIIVFLLPMFAVKFALF